MASFPASAISNPDIRSAKNGGENLIGLQTKTMAIDTSDQRERNKNVERHRRKSMSHLFYTLHSLLPYPIPKTDKVSVLSEAINYIPILRTKLEHLKNEKSVLLRSKSEDIDHRVDGSKVDVAINVEENRVDITLSRVDRWPTLVETLKELERQGFELINCSSFVSDTKYFRHFNTKCSHASVLSPESLRNTLQKIDSTPSPNV